MSVHACDAACGENAVTVLLELLARSDDSDFQVKKSAAGASQNLTARRTHATLVDPRITPALVKLLGVLENSDICLSIEYICLGGHV